MSAFNARLRPKTIFGLPLYAVASATLMLPMAAMAILLPSLVLKMVFGFAAVVCLMAAVFFLVLGNDLPFIRVRWQARREGRCVTAETGGCS